MRFAKYVGVGFLLVLGSPLLLLLQWMRRQVGARALDLVINSKDGGLIMRRLVLVLVLLAACSSDSQDPTLTGGADGVLQDGGSLPGTGGGGAGRGTGTGTGDGQPGGSPCDGEPPATWVPLSATGQPRARIAPMPRALPTEHGMVLLGASPDPAQDGAAEAGGVYDLCADAWTPIAASSGVRDAVSAGTVTTAAWTGDQILVWGGYRQTPMWTGYPEGKAVWVADRYDFASGAWSAMNRSGEPTVRETAAELWTGSRLLVWGGVAQSGDRTWANHADGALYDPATDSWSPMASAGAPAGRGFVVPPIWTGEKLLVWGGYRNTTGLGLSPVFEVPMDAASYDPASDSWTPLPAPTVAVYSQVLAGEKVIVLGQLDGFTTPGTIDFEGAVFDLATNAWSPMRAPDASMAAGVEASGRRLFWTGTELLLFVQRVEAGRGIAVLLRYDPAADTWSRTEVPAAPAFAYWQSVILHGDEVVISGDGQPSRDARGVEHRSTQLMTFDAKTSTWTMLPVLENRAFPVVVVSAGQILVWGGVDIYPDVDAPLTCGSPPPSNACDPITPMISEPLGDGVRIGL